MQMVIDIPEDEYQNILHTGKASFCVVNAIEAGTVLPKGHGRLIDADKLEYTCNSDECGMLTGCNHCQYHIITEDEVDNAPTIIEADRSK